MSAFSDLNSRAAVRLAAVALSALLLYFALRGVDWGQVGRLLLAARFEWLAAGAAIAVLSYILRALRWRVLLTAAGPVEPVAVYWANMAGYLGNNLLPARMGEVIRTVLICSRSGSSRVFVLTTALAERLADAFVLALVASTMLAALPASPVWLRDTATAVSVVVAFSMTLLAVAPRFERGLHRLLDRLPDPRWGERLRSPLSAMLAGLRSFHSLNRAAGFSAYTVAIWTLDASGSILLARALGLDLSFGVALLLLAALGLGSSVPSTPGYVGIYQFAAVTTLTPFGFSRSDALAYIIVAQVLGLVVIAAPGAVGLLQYRKLNRPLPAAAARPPVSL